MYPLIGTLYRVCTGMYLVWGVAGFAGRVFFFLSVHPHGCTDRGACPLCVPHRFLSPQDHPVKQDRQSVTDEIVSPY